MDGGTATVHSYNEGRQDEGEPPMGSVVDEKMRPFGGYRSVPDDEMRESVWD